MNAFASIAQDDKGSKELVFVDTQGVIRWKNDGKEIALFGANYCLPSACDYRAAGYVTRDRKAMVNEDMEHFARMGWDALRLGFWGDFENSDTSGNLIENNHLDLMDYVIAKASERGIYLLLSPIITYSSQWPDAMNDTSGAHGFSTYFKKSELGTNPKAIKAQVNYLKQLLNHINPYTHNALKNEPNIIMVEMINEPWHHSDDLKGSVDYINALVDAVRSVGCEKIVLHNYSQDFKIAKALQESKIQGLTFAWYPTGLNSGNMLAGNYLPVVDHYSEEMLRPEISKLARIVYEFDTPDLLTGYMYPAMARSFREVGAQWATMFSYDMLKTAPYNLGWQTHCLNMVYTPTKAISAMIAAEVMKQIPRYENFGKYPTNTSFGNFNIDYEKDLGELKTDDKFYYSNNTSSNVADAKKLKHIIGYGSSPIVQYNGRGIYFLDKIKFGVWRLEIYPDAIVVKDPFNMPSPGKEVIRCLYKKWPLTIKLDELGGTFSVNPLNANNSYSTVAVNGQFSIEPGVYILSATGDFNHLVLPEKIAGIGMKEFYAPVDSSGLLDLVVDYHREFDIAQPVNINADIFSPDKPDRVVLYYRRLGTRSFSHVEMINTGGYKYSGEIHVKSSVPGWLEYCITVKKGNQNDNFPSRSKISPDDWNYSGNETWSSRLINRQSPLTLMDPSEDIGKIAFTRIGDNIRFGIFNVVQATDNGRPAFRLEMPYKYDSLLDDYTLSVSIKDKIELRKKNWSEAKNLVLRVRGNSLRQAIYITLVENDGTSWAKKISLTPDWNEYLVPLNEMTLSKGVMLPLGYPGRWDYWYTPASGRGIKDDKVKLTNVDWIQLSIRPEILQKGDQSDDSWIEIESVTAKW
jgi:Cellulase (glycosyl hydrolase family 5)